MTLKALPHYFIIKIEIEKQKQRKEKIGSLFVHASHTFMQRNVQSGQIVSIGEIAAKQFPQAKIGDELIVHHFCENEDHLVFSDEIYNYYIITASNYNGKRNETYGAFSNGNIIPHPEFVFIEPEIKEKEIAANRVIDCRTKQVGSLILFENWEEKRESKEEKAKILMDEIKNSSKGKSLRDDVKIALEDKQSEAGKLTSSLNKKQYLPYEISAYNPILQRSYNKDLKTVSKILALDQAAMTTLEFNSKEYIIVESKYCVAIAS